MKKGLNYFAVTVSIFLGSVYFLSLLLNKYASLAFEHLLETCKEATSSFLSTGTNYLGLILSAFTLILPVGLLLNMIFSYKKTKKKLDGLLERKISTPRKLRPILIKNEIDESLVIVVKQKKDLALTIGFSRPKIIVSEGLIKRLKSKELEAVILHELYHLREKHPLMLVVGEILSSTLFLLPVVKDLTRNMRVSLENEADWFTVSQQKTSKHLSSALSQVKSQFDFYPSFSKRGRYKFRKINLTLSALTIILGLYLFKLPTTGEIVAQENTSGSNCGENLCSTHCLTQDGGFTLMATAFQTIYSP